MSPLRPWLAIALMLLATNASAHISSNGFLTVNAAGSRASGALELAVRDAELAVGLDDNADGKLTWGEVRGHQADLVTYVRSRLTIGDGGNPCATDFDSVQINERVDGAYLWIPFTAVCSSVLRDLSIDYRLLQDVQRS